MLRYQLLRPLAYLTIRGLHKTKLDYLVPSVAAILTTLFIFLLPVRPQIYMANGLLTQIAGLLQILPGFYLAALAAIATFNKSDMDTYLPEPTPTVRVQIQHTDHTIRLTRRRMLSLLFGYLTFISLFLVIMLLAANTAASSVKAVLPTGAQLWANLGFMVVFSFSFWHMISVTLFGLYQLSDRMHQPS